MVIHEVRQTHKVIMSTNDYKYLLIEAEDLEEEEEKMEVAKQAEEEEEEEESI